MNEIATFFVPRSLVISAKILPPLIFDGVVLNTKLRSFKFNNSLELSAGDINNILFGIVISFATSLVISGHAAPIIVVTPLLIKFLLLL